MVKTTIYLPTIFIGRLSRRRGSVGTSEVELIRTAVRHELLGTPPPSVPTGVLVYSQRRVSSTIPSTPMAASTSSAPSGATDASDASVRSRWAQFATAS